MKLLALVVIGISLAFSACQTIPADRFRSENVADMLSECSHHCGAVGEVSYFGSTDDVSLQCRCLKDGNPQLDPAEARGLGIATMRNECNLGCAAQRSTNKLSIESDGFTLECDCSAATIDLSSVPAGSINPSVISK